MKRNGAPVGESMYLFLDAENKELLEQSFRLHPKSSYFFLPFKIRKGDSRWKKPKYASTTLQAINTQTFGPALLHQKTDPNWGWATDYISFLKTQLPRGAKINLLDLAVWFYRNEPWDELTTRQDIVRRFSHEIQLTTIEIEILFNLDIATDISEEDAFQQVPADWSQIIGNYDLPVDVPPEAGATLRFLEFSNLGPVKSLSLEPATRLNIITGDNGQGDWQVEP